MDFFFQVLIGTLNMKAVYSPETSSIKLQRVASQKRARIEFTTVL
jgi:hypothetical protein